MRYYENIILDKNIKSVKKLLKGGIYALDYYVVCINKAGNGLMEIISVNNALKSDNADRDYGLIAVLKGRIAAENMTAELVGNWLLKNDNLNGFKEYYNSRCK